MTRPPGPPATRIASSTPDDIVVRGKSLCRDLLGKLTFTEMTCLLVLGRVPSPGETALVDACLVALMEHGLTPSVLAARLVYGSAPEALQGAVAAGLLGVGGRFVGTVEGCAALLDRMVAAADPPAEAARIVEEHRSARRPLPGFGHNLHVPDDPRPPRLFAVARERGLAGRHIAALQTLSAALDRALGRHLTINATGAVAAALRDVGVPAEILRGFALIARCAGLVGHLHEEQQRPLMTTIWEAAERAVAYDGDGAGASGPDQPEAAR
jgi:citrate synthase